MDGLKFSVQQYDVTVCYRSIFIFWFDVQMFICILYVHTILSSGLNSEHTAKTSPTSTSTQYTATATATAYNYILIV